jgi:outer membrane immunogenic protein
MKRLGLAAKGLLTAAGLTFVAISAEAADVYAGGGGLKDGVYGGPVNWSGFYFGFNAGAATNNDRTSYSYAYAPGNGTNNFSDFFGNATDNAGASGMAGVANVGGLNAAQSAIADGIIPSSLGPSNSTVFIGGAQLGYNRQYGSLVFGAETDINGLGQTSAHRFSGIVSGITPVPYSYENAGSSRSSVDWLATERLRAGFAFDRFLPYVTGGFAFGGTRASSNSAGTDGSTSDNFSGSDSSLRAGWVVGGGLDYWLSSQWSFRVEGLYYNLGTVNYAVSPLDSNSASEGLYTTARHTFDGTVVRAALNHPF